MTVYTSFQETSLSLYQQLVTPGGLRLRGGERETGRKVHLWWIYQGNLNSYNSYPKFFDFSINSKKKHVQHSFWSKLGNLTFHKTIFIFNQYLISYPIRTWSLYLLRKEKRIFSEISPKDFDLRNIWLWINLMRWRYDASAHRPGLSVRTRTRFKFPAMQSIHICFKFRNTHDNLKRFLMILRLDTFTHILNTNLPKNRGRKDIFWNQV